MVISDQSVHSTIGTNQVISLGTMSFAPSLGGEINENSSEARCGNPHEFKNRWGID